MSKTDLGDSAGAGNQKQATNFKEAFINGINQKISEKDPNPQELNFQKILSPESGQLSPNDTTIDGKLIRIKDRHGLPNVGAKSSNEDSRSVSSTKSAEKRKRVTGKSDESISKIGINYSGEVSGRKKSGREGTSLIPGRGISKLAESASSTKTLETVASGGENSLVQADVSASVNEGLRRSSREY